MNFWPLPILTLLLIPACAAPPVLVFPLSRDLRGSVNDGAIRQRACPPEAGDCLPSPFLDFESPVHAMDGFWVFSARRAGEAWHQVYLLKDRASAPGAPALPTDFDGARPFPGMPEGTDNRTPFITGDAVILLYSSSKSGSIPRMNESGETEPSYDLYWTAIVQGDWARHAPMAGGINTAADESCPSLSNDRKHLYFTRRARPEARGVLYEASFENGSFHNPAPLPPIVNGEYDNDCLRPVDNEGGFVFQTHRGEAGDRVSDNADVFFVSYRHGRWGVPVPAAPDFNSRDYEGEPWASGGLVYFTRDTSRRDPAGSSPTPGKGNPTHHAPRNAGSPSSKTLTALARGRFHRNEQYRRRLITGRKHLAPVYTIQIRVENAVTQAGIPATLQIDAGSGLGAGELGFARVEFKADAEGRVVIPVSPSVDTLQLTITEPAFLPHFQSLDVVEAAGNPPVIRLREVKKKESFDLHAIHFEYNSANLTEDSFSLLDSLTEYMKKNPAVRFEIIGHTDLTGSQSFNARLSLRRAESVRAYLVSRGIESGRLTATGMGKLRPLQNERSPAADQLNRRTEFKILDD